MPRLVPSARRLSAVALPAAAAGTAVAALLVSRSVPDLRPPKIATPAVVSPSTSPTTVDAAPLPGSATHHPPRASRSASLVTGRRVEPEPAREPGHGEPRARRPDERDATTADLGPEPAGEYAARRGSCTRP